MLPLKKLDPAVNTQVIFSDLFNYDQTLLSGTFKRELLNQENKK
jgi:hypothetical protein